MSIATTQWRALLLLAAVLALALGGCRGGGATPADRLADEGLAHWRAGDLQGALDRFDEALQADPKHLKALYNSGIALLASGRGAAAAERFERFLELRPDDALGHLQLARAVLRTGQREEAVRILQRSVSLGLDDLVEWRAAGDLQALAHDLRFHQLEAVVAQRAGERFGAGAADLLPGQGYEGLQLGGVTAPGQRPTSTCEMPQ